MTIEIDKAFFTRWTNQSLDDTITGGLWHGLAEEGTAMPYASYSNVSDSPLERTRSGRYGTKTVQIQVWDTTPDLVGSHIEAIKNAFVHSDRASTNPLRSQVSDEIVFNIEPAANPMIIQESAEVWQAIITLEVMYVEDRNLSPA